MQHFLNYKQTLQRKFFFVAFRFLLAVFLDVRTAGG